MTEQTLIRIPFAVEDMLAVKWESLAESLDENMLRSGPTHSFKKQANESSPKGELTYPGFHS